jgi:hypothetical protein
VLLAFFVFAALWVLAWVVLLVLGFVNLVFRPLPDGNSADTDPGLVCRE